MVMKVEQIPGLEIGDDQLNLTPEQEELIAKQAISEVDGESASDEDTPTPKPQEEEKPEETPGQEKPEEQPEEEPEPEKKQEETPPEETDEEKERKEQARLEEIAKKEGKTVDEIKSDEDKTLAVIQKYKGDPKEIAKALRNTQSAFDKMRNELEEHKKQVAQIEEASIDQTFNDYCDKNREKIVEDYRKENPHASYDKSEDEIFDLAKGFLRVEFRNVVQKKKDEIVKQADEKRNELLNSLSEPDKKFISEVKGVLDKTSPRQILDEKFKIEEIVRWAKGIHYDEDVKAAYERGLKAGKEEPEIIGEKAKVGTKTKGSSKPTKFTMSDAQKQRAREMFEGTQMNEQEMFEAYAEIYPEEFAKPK